MLINNNSDCEEENSKCSKDSGSVELGAVCKACAHVPVLQNYVKLSICREITAEVKGHLQKAGKAQRT